jgi:hypothetical protein
MSSQTYCKNDFSCPHCQTGDVQRRLSITEEASLILQELRQSRCTVNKILTIAEEASAIVDEILAATSTNPNIFDNM